MVVFVTFVFLCLKVGGNFRPLLVIPVTFNVLLTGVPNTGLTIRCRSLRNFVSLVTNEVIGRAANTIYAPKLVSFLCFNIGTKVCPPLVFLNVNTVASFTPLVTGPSDFVLNTTTRLNVFFACINTVVLNFAPRRTNSVNVVNNTSNPATVFMASGLTPRLLNAVTITTCSCVTLIPIVRPPVVHTLAAGGRHDVIVNGLHPISGLRGVLFPVVMAIVISLLLPSTTALINVLVLNGLLGRDNEAREVTGTTRGRLVGVMAVVLNLSINTAADTRDFLGLGSVFVVTLNLVTFSMNATNNIIFNGVVYILAGNGMGPLVNSTNISTIPVTTHMDRGINRGRGPSGFLLVRTVNPGISNIVNSTITTNILLALLGWLFGVRGKYSGRALFFNLWWEGGLFGLVPRSFTLTTYYSRERRGVTLGTVRRRTIGRARNPLLVLTNTNSKGAAILMGEIRRVVNDKLTTP